jgi:micrococcal nuclease
LMGLNGKTIRVRGWVRNYNGPLIEITHPQQIEVLK